MKIDKTFLIKRILPVMAGAVLGYAYYYFIGCNNGSCAITSNPYVSTAYGAVLGVILAIPSKKRATKENDDE